MTEFTETAALIAALEEDDNKLNRILSQMTDGEMHALEIACADVIAGCRKWKGAGVDLT